MASGYSFPSGHALNSVVIVLAVLIVLWPGLSRSRRVAAGTGAALLVLVVGVDRVALGVHFPTDVVGGVDRRGGCRRGCRGRSRDPRRPSAQPARPPGPARRAAGRAPSAGCSAGSSSGGLAILTLMVALGLLVTRVADDRWPLTAEERLSCEPGSRHGRPRGTQRRCSCATWGTPRSSSG